MGGLTAFQEASRGHLKRLNALVDKGSIPRLRKLYTEALTELEGKLAKAIGAGASQFTINQHRAALAQAHQGLASIARSMGTALGNETAKIQEASAKALIGDVKKMERKVTGSTVQLPIEQAARFTGVIDKRKTSLLKLNKTSMAKYGAGMVKKVEGVLAQTLVQGESGFNAIDRVVKAMDTEWWKAERIVRTEHAWAYNATQVDAVQDSSKMFPDMMMRWTELVTDVTLTPYDDRVGDDSIAMHGQLAKPGGAFRMPPVAPPGLKISQSLLNKTWTHPPNRPNDRAVLQPWRPGWGWGWELVGGAKVVR